MKTIGDWSDRDLLICLTSLAAAIRLYLVLTSFCISGDGPQYLAMARDFSAGQYANALAPVFSPLYPFLISIVQRLVTDWEICGQTVSLFFGTATVPIVFMLFMAVYNRRDVAIGAAALTTIHPELAEFSASVRTEAGFIFLMLSSVYLLLSAIRPQQ